MRAVGLFVCLCLLGAMLIGGLAPLGRVLLAIGQPEIAARVFDDAAWRGVAQYRAGEYRSAAATFAAEKLPYNRGNAEAMGGDYAAALEAYDIAILQGEMRAQANFDVVAAFFAGVGIDPESLALFPERKDGPEVESFVARGDGRAAGTGDEVTNTNSMLGLAELESRGRLGVRRIFDDRYMVADERWLIQLEDVPGAFMAARILQEHKRRVKLGLAPPDPEESQ